jgi:DNA (cytosine-5)-methyltransferase 1
MGIFGMAQRRIRALDLFAGAGGSTHGARLAKVHVVAAVDCWDLAQRTYLANFPDVKFYLNRCENVAPEQVARDVGDIDLIIASPECTSHTCARGNRDRSESSRETALQVIRFARVLKPRWLVVENVIQMRQWSRYPEWLNTLADLGYKRREQVLNAADFGVAQSRRRLFVAFDTEREPQEVLPPRLRRVPVAKRLIEMNGKYSFTALRIPQRAEATLVRADRAIAALGSRNPFLLVYYGSDGAGGWQRLDVPLRTVTTLDRFAYVRRRDGLHEMRMLQVPELAKAMGFPARFQLPAPTRRDRIKLLGNAVCPPVMKAVIESLVGQTTGSAT